MRNEPQWHHRYMIPTIALITLIAALAGEPNTLTVPPETLAPSLGAGVYFGDDMECTAANESTWRYATDKTFYLCNAGEWRAITIEAR